jgi:hypothetical protein
MHVYLKQTVKQIKQSLHKQDAHVKKLGPKMTPPM